MRIISVFFILLSFMYGVTYTNIYDKQPRYYNDKNLVGFFNAFDPSNASSSASSTYSFNYYTATGSSPYFSFTNNMKYYKVYIPEGVSSIQIAGGSYPSNTWFKVYVSYSEQLDISGAINAGTKMWSTYLTQLQSSSKPTVMINYNQTSKIISTSKGIKSGWIYIGIVMDTDQSNYSLNMNYKFTLVYNMTVNKTTYNSWFASAKAAANGGNNPGDTSGGTTPVVDTKPSISLSPLTANAGKNNTFTLSASGTTPITWEWTLKDNEGNALSGTGSKVTLNNPEMGTKYTLTATATNTAGTDTDETTITVVDPSAVNYTNIYDTQPRYYNKKNLSGFFNAFDPTNASSSTSSSYSFNYYTSSGSSPYFTFTNSIKYYKLYIPEGVETIQIAGGSFPSNTWFNLYVSYDKELDIDGAIDAGTKMWSSYLTQLQSDEKPTIKINYDQTSKIISTSKGVKSGWIYIGIVMDTAQSNYSKNTDYRFTLVYNMTVNKSTYDAWYAQAKEEADGASNPKETSSTTEPTQIIEVPTKLNKMEPAILMYLLN